MKYFSQIGFVLVCKKVSLIKITKIFRHYIETTTGKTQPEMQMNYSKTISQEILLFVTK